MHRLTPIAAVLLCAVVVMPYPPSSDSFAASEQARVRAHLDSAEREQRAAPVMGLTLSQRKARARALDRLHEYWVHGVFPKNVDVLGQFVPYFVDRNHTRCAMAYLIEESGHGPFVARVAATRNNARIAELRSDPQLVAWLGENGMTLEEAARVQPDYCGGFGNCMDASCCPRNNHDYNIATAVSLSADVVTVVLNTVPSRHSRTLTGGLGVAAGLVGVAIGVPNFDAPGSQHMLGIVNAGMGTVAAVFGVYRLTGRRSTSTPVSFTPWLSSSGTPGLSGRITF